MKRAAAVLLAGALCASALPAQTVATGVSSDSVRVGDPVRVLLRVESAAPGAGILLPDSLMAGDDFENMGRGRMRRDTLPGGGTRISAAYPIIVWRPGALKLPPLPMIVRSAGAERTIQVALPTINVVSVLPADTTNIQAKPPKDVWGADRVWWPWLLAAALLVLLALLWWRYRRRRQVPVDVAVVPTIDPRQRVLQELQRIRDLQLIEQGQLKQFYIMLSDALRAFAAMVEQDWSTDLTTEELAARLKRRPESAPLLRLLRAADMVKFARRQASAAEARADLDAATEWAQSFDRRAEPAEAA